MEIVAVVDQPLVPANRASLVDNKVFCIDESGWFMTPVLLDQFANACTGGTDFHMPDGAARSLPDRTGPLGFADRDVKRLATSALSNPKAVNMHLLVDGDNDARDLLGYYRAVITYLIQHGGRVNFYAKNAGGAFAELAMQAGERFMSADGHLTFRDPVMRPAISPYTPEIGIVDYANQTYWRMVEDFLMRNTAEGMRSLLRSRLIEVMQNPANMQRQIAFSADEAWDFGLIDEPRDGVDGLCKTFEVRVRECVDGLSLDHPVRMFFDVDGREQRYLSSRRPLVLEGLDGGAKGNGGSVRGGHLKLIK